MRQVALDTETTGLDVGAGHRVIEIGCVELIDRRVTGRHWHQYLNPDRLIDSGAMAVHGIRDELLVDKPRFREVVGEFLAFLQDSELLIHNASFDLGFLNRELRLADSGGKGLRLEERYRVIDTLALARARHTGQKNSLDALCKRYKVDNSHRDLHGALLDAEILAKVYLAMTREQVSLLGSAENNATHAKQTGPVRLSKNRSALPVVAPTPEEETAHRDRLAAIDKASGGNCLFRKLDEPEGV